jgi:hypothetical protein
MLSLNTNPEYFPHYIALARYVLMRINFLKIEPTKEEAKIELGKFGEIYNKSKKTITFKEFKILFSDTLIPAVKELQLSKKHLIMLLKDNNVLELIPEVWLAGVDFNHEKLTLMGRKDAIKSLKNFIQEMLLSSNEQNRALANTLINSLQKNGLTAIERRALLYEILLFLIDNPQSCNEIAFAEALNLLDKFLINKNSNHKDFLENKLLFTKSLLVNLFNKKFSFSWENSKIEISEDLKKQEKEKYEIWVDYTQSIKDILYHYYVLACRNPEDFTAEPFVTWYAYYENKKLKKEESLEEYRKKNKKLQLPTKQLSILYDQMVDTLITSFFEVPNLSVSNMDCFFSSFQSLENMWKVFDFFKVSGYLNNDKSLEEKLLKLEQSVKKVKVEKVIKNE